MQDDDAQELELRVVPESARPGEIVRLVLENSGPRRFRLGDPYTLDRCEGGGRVRLSPGDEGFKMALRGLAPGGRYEQFAQLPSVLAAGSYALTKQVRSIEDQDELSVEAIFTVLEDNRA